MADTEEKPNATFLHREDSPTAASAHNRLFRASGVQTYRVAVASATGMMVQHDVEAASGDEAAEEALKAFPGAKVAHVAPAPQKAA